MNGSFLTSKYIRALSCQFNKRYIFLTCIKNSFSAIVVNIQKKEKKEKEEEEKPNKPKNLRINTLAIPYPRSDLAECVSEGIFLIKIYQDPNFTNVLYFSKICLFGQKRRWKKLNWRKSWIWNKFLGLKFKYWKLQVY